MIDTSVVAAPPSLQQERLVSVGLTRGGRFTDPLSPVDLSTGHTPSVSRTDRSSPPPVVALPACPAIAVSPIQSSVSALQTVERVFAGDPLCKERPALGAERAPHPVAGEGQTAAALSGEATQALTALSGVPGLSSFLAGVRSKSGADKEFFSSSAEALADHLPALSVNGGSPNNAAGRDANCSSSVLVEGFKSTQSQQVPGCGQVLTFSSAEVADLFLQLRQLVPTGGREVVQGDCGPVLCSISLRCKAHQNPDGSGCPYTAVALQGANSLWYVVEGTTSHAPLPRKSSCAGGADSSSLSTLADVEREDCSKGSPLLEEESQTQVACESRRGKESVDVEEEEVPVYGEGGDVVAFTKSHAGVEGVASFLSRLQARLGRKLQQGPDTERAVSGRAGSSAPRPGFVLGQASSESAADKQKVTKEAEGRLPTPATRELHLPSSRTGSAGAPALAEKGLGEISEGEVTGVCGVGRSVRLSRSELDAAVEASSDSFFAASSSSSVWSQDSPSSSFAPTESSTCHSSPTLFESSKVQLPESLAVSLKVHEAPHLCCPSSSAASLACGGPLGFTHSGVEETCSTSQTSLPSLREVLSVPSRGTPAPSSSRAGRCDSLAEGEGSTSGIFENHRGGGGSAPRVPHSGDLSFSSAPVAAAPLELMVVSGKRKEGEASRGEDLHATTTAALLPCAASQEALGRVEQLQQLLQNQPALLSAASSLVPLLNDMAGTTTSGKQQSVFGTMGGDADYALAGTGGPGEGGGLHRHHPDIALASSSSPNGGSTPRDLFSSAGGLEGCRADEMERAVPKSGDKLDEGMVVISANSSALGKKSSSETKDGSEEAHVLAYSEERVLHSGLRAVVEDAGTGVGQGGGGLHGELDSSDFLESRIKNNAHSPTATLSTGEGNVPPASVKFDEEPVPGVSPVKTSAETGGSRLLRMRDKILGQHPLSRKRKKASSVMTSPDASSGDMSRSAEEDNGSNLLDESCCSAAEDAAIRETTAATSGQLTADGDDHGAGGGGGRGEAEEMTEMNHEEGAAALEEEAPVVKKEIPNASQCGRKRRVRTEGSVLTAADGSVGGAAAAAAGWPQSDEGRGDADSGMEAYDASAENMNDIDSSSSVMPNSGGGGGRAKREEAEPKRSRRSTRSSAAGLVSTLNNVGTADVARGEGEAERECSPTPGFVFDNTEQSALSSMPRPSPRDLQHHLFLEEPGSAGRSVGLPGSFPSAASAATASSAGGVNVSGGGGGKGIGNYSSASPRVPGDSHTSADVERNDLMMRPGVSYYGGRQAWVAEIKYGGRRRFKVFSVAKYGYEGAKQMAVDTRERWEEAREAGELDQLMMSSQRHQCPVQSGVKGVYYDTARKGWRVVVTLNCRQMSKFFLASKFGNAEAKRLAIECRQMWLDAIQNGRADDVFEKARKLVSFKTKGSNNQNNTHSNGTSTTNSSVNNMLLGGNAAGALANQSVILQAAGGIPPSPSAATAATASGGATGGGPLGSAGGASTAAASLVGKFPNSLAGNAGDSSSTSCVFGSQPGTAAAAVGGETTNDLFLASAASHAAGSSSLIPGLSGGGAASSAGLAAAAAAGGVDGGSGAAFLPSSSSFAATLRGGNAGGGTAADAGAAAAAAAAAAGVFGSADAAANALLATTAGAGQTTGAALDPKILQHHQLAAAHQQLVLQQWSNEAGNVANVCLPSALLSAAAAGGGATDSDGHARDPTASAVLQQQQHQQLQLQLLQELRGGSLPLLADVLWPAGAAAAAAAAGNGVTEPSCTGVVMGESGELVGLQGARNGSALLGGAAGGAVGGIVGDGQPPGGDDQTGAGGPCGLSAPVLSLLLQQQGAQQHQQLVAAAVAARGCGGSVSPGVSPAALCGFGAGAGREGNNMMLLGAAGACPTLLSPSIMTDGSTADPSSVVGNNLFLGGASSGLLLQNTNSKRARRAQQQQLGVGGVGLVSGGHAHPQSAGMATSSRRTKKENTVGQDSSRSLSTSAGGGGSETSTCEVRGVYLDTRNNAWAATMGVHGRNVKKSFAVAKHGYETALQLAIHARRQLERLYWGPNHPSNSTSSSSASNSSSGPQQQQNAPASASGGGVPTPSPAGESSSSSSRSAVTTPSLPSHSPSPAAPTPAQLTLLQQQQLVQLQQQQLAGQLQQGLCWNPSNAAAAAAVVNACRGGEEEEGRLVAAAGAAEMLALRSAMEKNAEVLSGLAEDPTVSAEAAARTAAVTGSLLYGSQFTSNQASVNPVSTLSVGGSSATGVTGGDGGGVTSSSGSGSSSAISGLAGGAGTPSPSSSGDGVVVVGGVGGDRVSPGRSGARPGLQVSRGSANLQEGRSPGTEGSSAAAAPGLLCAEAAAAAGLPGAGSTAADGATQHPHPTSVGGPTLLGCGLEGREGGMPVVMPLATNPTIGLLQAAAAAGGGVAGGGVGVAAGGLMMRDALAALLLQLDPQQRAALLQGEMMTALNGGIAPSLSPVQHQQQMLMCNADAQQLLLAVAGAEGTSANSAAACVDEVGLASATRGLLSSGLNEALLQQGQQQRIGGGGAEVGVLEAAEAANEATEDTGRGLGEAGKAENSPADSSSGVGDGGEGSIPQHHLGVQGPKEEPDDTRAVGLVSKAAEASSSPETFFGNALHMEEKLDGLPVHLQRRMTSDESAAASHSSAGSAQEGKRERQLSASGDRQEAGDMKGSPQRGSAVGIAAGTTPTPGNLEGSNRAAGSVSKGVGGSIVGEENLVEGLRKVQEGEAFALLSSASRLQGAGSEIMGTAQGEVTQNTVGAAPAAELSGDEKASM